MKEIIITKNIMEDIVEGKLTSLMDTAGCCTCECCHADVFAYALNHLPPHYVSSKIGNVYTQFKMLETQNQVDIIAAIINAIEMVKRNPRHDIEVNRENKPVL